MNNEDEKIVVDSLSKDNSNGIPNVREYLEYLLYKDTFKARIGWFIAITIFITITEYHNLIKGFDWVIETILGAMLFSTYLLFPSIIVGTIKLRIVNIPLLNFILYVGQLVALGIVFANNNEILNIIIFITLAICVLLHTIYLYRKMKKFNYTIDDINYYENALLLAGIKRD